MDTSDPLKDLELLIRSRYGVIHLDTTEDDRAESLIVLLADLMNLPLFIWTATKGLRRTGAAEPVYGSVKPAMALAHIESSRISALYAFHGLGPYLEDATVSARLKDAARQFTDRTAAIVILGPVNRMPEALRPLSATVRLPPPKPAEYRELLTRIARDLAARAKAKVELSPPDVNRLLQNLRGLTLLEAEKVLTKAILEDGRLTAEDIGRVVDAKKAIVEREGLLEYYPHEETMGDIAGLRGLKEWLEKRRGIIESPEKARKFGLSFPKGVLLLGVQGCGKSLCARAVAREWGLPLLKLDPSNLYNKYVGESEKNFQRAVRLAERMAPVVLWIDEIEKAFSSAGSEADSGLSQRVFGTFLSWLQDRKGDVFVVATANDVNRLPPEFVRKGRFDEIFFVDLPDAEARKAVFEIHLKRRGQDLVRFDLAALVGRTEGFSGSEIEQVIVSGLYTAFAAGAELTTAVLLEEVSRTRPISLTMAEKIEALRDWARERTVSAQ